MVSLGSGPALYRKPKPSEQSHWRGLKETSGGGSSGL